MEARASHGGRIAVVTGAARGFGQAIAVGLAAHGAAVVAVDRLSCTETGSMIASAGGTCDPVEADVTDENDVRRLAECAGECSILVNNAALLHSAPVGDLDYATWRRVLAANLDSQFLVTTALLPGMISRGYGRIVNVASSSLYTSTPGLVAYMASKGGVIGLTSGLANDVGKHGITVNAVSPGLTRTPGVEADIAAGRLPAAATEEVVAHQAIPRPGRPGDLVGAVLYLTGEDAGFVTGQMLVVDGGMTRR